MRILAKDSTGTLQLITLLPKFQCALYSFLLGMCGIGYRFSCHHRINQHKDSEQNRCIGSQILLCQTLASDRRTQLLHERVICFCVRATEGDAHVDNDPVHSAKHRFSTTYCVSKGVYIGHNMQCIYFKSLYSGQPLHKSGVLLLHLPRCSSTFIKDIQETPLARGAPPRT